MKKLLILALASLVAATAITACNEDYEEAEDTSASVVIRSFALSKDDNVLANLDTVFFTIDLKAAQIYNADSLPYGTKVTKLVPRIGTVEAVSAAQLYVKRAVRGDTVYNYLTNSTDSIDFTNPVTLSITSPDGLVKADYQIKVNVHKVKSDSLVWDKTAKRALPSAFNVPTRQHTVATATGIYCLTEAGGNWSIATALSPVDDEWHLGTPAIPAGADISTFSASDNALYILAGGKLYSSGDGGVTWADTGEEWSNIYGGYNATVIGNQRLSNGRYIFVDYPRGSLYGQSLDSDMPVSGTSAPVAFTLPLGGSTQIVLVGGVKADGALSSATWAYDGYGWAKISNKAISKPLKGMYVAPFFAFKVSNTFRVTRYTVLLAFGGTDGKSNNATVYISNDYGMSWNKADQLLQLPVFVPAVYDAQAFVYNQAMTVGRASGDVWTYYDNPYGYTASSRVTEPVDEWECPFIYVFGGITAENTLSNTIWRATINRMMFEPLY